MISLDKLEYIREKYGYYSSWAVWSNEGIKPKDNMGDLSIFDININTNLLKQLKPNIILCALNISRLDIKEPFANFHVTNLAYFHQQIHKCFAIYKV